MATGNTERNRVQPAPGAPPENRDPNDLNSHITIDFYSVLGEPQDTKSFDCVWEFSEVFYDCFRSCCYKLATLCCGICIAISWGVDFVPTIFTTVWCLTPCHTLLHNVCTLWCKTCCTIMARCFIAPWCKSFGYLFRHFGDGTNRRPESPDIFPKSKKRSPPPLQPKPTSPIVKSEESEKKVVPVPVRASIGDYDKDKMVNSVRRQMMLY